VSEPISLRSRPYASGELHPGLAEVEARRHRSRPGLHLALLLATFCSAALAYAVHAGADVFANPSAIAVGIPYALALIAILLAHELGHYAFARLHQVEATLPFFIPAPPLFFIGTLGAFIRMRTLPRDRQSLFDIGAAGPWAGILVAVPLLAIGLALSDVRPVETADAGWYLGEPLLFKALSWLVLGTSGAEATIILHPVAMAGWVGLLVTALNLMPVGQLDGGHIVYAAVGERWHRWISVGCLTTLLVLSIGGAPSWFVWAALLFALGIRHPRLADNHTPLDRGRRLGALASLALFVVTFMPEPLHFVPPPAPRDPHAIPISAPAPPIRSIPL
jgi:membrane-associated protease RseP (regulator of RpoE activity)